MKYLNIFALALIFFSLSFITPKSQDYARHIELSLLFYECQRSGPLPKTNRIYWRHDSMIDAGKDVGVDLTGGYYDAGDNVKFNFPQAFSMTLLAWSGVEFAQAYKKIGQWKYLVEAVKWGADYLIKCHSGKDTLWVQVGSGQTDHNYWVAPEYIFYEYPSYKVDAANPGTEVAAETAAALAAASIMFKDEDSSYSLTLLKHAKEIYDFADKYRGDYTKSVPSISNFYGSFSGFNDELAWGAAWLLRATEDEKYYDKFKAISDAEYGSWDPKKFMGCTGPITWDDKRPGAYILIAEITKEERWIQNAYDYCDAILTQKKTPGGLWYDSSLSQWASNRYAANAASILAVFASILPETDPKRKSYIEFAKGQINYILGDNPAKVNYVVGAEENSPKAVHHRAASAVFDVRLALKPSFNIFTLYGALAGGPDGSDSYKDTRDNFQMNEVALDYNAGFTLALAALEHFGLGVKDTKVDFDRAWPPKAPTPDLTVEMTKAGLSISSGSGMLCSSWCVSFTMSVKIESIYGSTPYITEHPNYTVCNKRDNHFLDGEGTPQTANFIINEANFEAPKEYEVLCDGFQAADNQGKPIYKPEFGHSYKVTSPGGPENTKALFEESECWPSYVC